MEESEAAGPPTALRVDVSARLEQDVKHLTGAHPGNQGGIKCGDGIVDLRSQFGTLFEQPAEQNRVLFGKRLLELLKIRPRGKQL